MPMHDPPHPGEIVKEECLAPLGLSIEEAARGLGVDAQVFAEPGSLQGGHFHRDGNPTFKGLWFDSGNLAWNANGL